MGNPFTRADVQSFDDLAGLTIVAVNMPNAAGVRNDPWQKYLTTVKKIAQATGYGLLSLMQTAFRAPLEVGDRPPVAQYTVGAANEGSPVVFDASSSSDPDLARTDVADALTYSWRFSDGVTATGPTVARTFPRFGSVTATLIVTDAFGWPSTVMQTLTVGDVAPTVSALQSANLIAGETYVGSGSFTDPGMDAWSATRDFGDGSAAAPLTLLNKHFAVLHRYASAGTYTLSVTVTDDGGASGTSTATVDVITPLAATRDLAQQVQALAEAGEIAQPRPLFASIDAAVNHLQRGENTPAANELRALLAKIAAETIAGRMSPDAARELSAIVLRLQIVLRT
jgi:PKD repeat protein